MNRLNILAMLVVTTGGALLLATKVQSQTGVFKNSVALQAATPGVSQSGHANIAGVMRAGQFVGGGAGLNNLQWSAITGAPTSFPPNGAAGGDLGGTYPNPAVTGLQGRGVSPTAPNIGQFLAWNGSNWIPSNSGIALVNLNATSLAFGTVPDGRLSGTYSGALTFPNAANVYAGDGSALTALNAAALASGILPSARVSGAYTGLTGTGTLTSGTWQASTIGSLYGGTGFTNYANGDLLVGNASNVLAKVPIGPNGYVLKSSGGTIAWSPNDASVSVPLALTGSNSLNILRVENTIANISGAAAIEAIQSGATGSEYAGKFTSASSAGKGVYGISTATLGNPSGIYGEATAPNARGVYGINTSAAGVLNYGVMGEIQSGTVGAGVYGFGGAVADGTGVLGKSNGAGGIGVRGEAGSTGFSIGVKGTSPSSSGVGVFGQSTGTGPGAAGGYFVGPTNSGAYGIFSTGYVGVYGGTTETGPAYGVFGESSNTAAGVMAGVFGRSAGTNGYGVRGETSGTSASGVYGRATSTTGFTQGVYGVTDSTNGIAVRGESLSVTGINYGGSFQSVSTNATSYGVYGQANAGANRYALWAQGDTGASGVKSFRIDHPLDPESKYLVHYASESPFPQNFYNGNATTDDRGYAWIELPDYFSAVNANFKYQLTVVDEGDSDEFIWAKVVVKIQGNRFRIRTNKPGVEVSWMVFADRNDPRIQAERPRDVRAKVGSEIGKYQSPEYFGQPKERGIFYRATDHAGK